jgi:glycosyltransferase involved in cell wall biosynthesis
VLEVPDTDMLIYNQGFSTCGDRFMEKNLISVIVPVYNTSEYLERCINSIRNQKYTNLEIWLIDDGSTDNSLEICRNFAKLDSRIQVLSKENGGQSSARNLGLNHIHGQYVGFVDSDDWIDEDFFYILYKNIIMYDADVSAVDYYITDGQKFDLSQSHETIEQWSANEAIDYFVRQTKTNVAVWNKLYKSSLLESARFKEGQFYEEYYFQFLALKSANRIVNSNRKLYYYFQRSDSTVHIKTAQKEMDNILAFYDCCKIVDGTFPLERKICESLMAEHLYFFYSCEKFNAEVRRKYYDILQSIDVLFKGKNWIECMENQLGIIVYSRQYHNNSLSDMEKKQLQKDFRWGYKNYLKRYSITQRIKYLLYYINLGISTLSRKR